MHACMHNDKTCIMKSVTCYKDASEHDWVLKWEGRSQLDPFGRVHVHDVSRERIVERFKLNLGSARLSLGDLTHTLTVLLKDRRQSRL